jgi:integrase
VRFHDLRHTFASHLIIDLGLDVAQVSRILGHATEIRRRMTSSPFARLLEPDREQADNVVAIARRPARRPAAPARRRPRWHLTAT